MKLAKDTLLARLIPAAALLIAVVFFPSFGRERLAPPPLPDAVPPEIQNLLPDPVPEPELTAAERMLAEMDLREKVFQLFIVFPQSVGLPRQSAGEHPETILQEIPVGGFLYDRSHMQSQEQVRAMLEATQAASKIPLILTCDEEGGRVNRLMGAVGTPYVGILLSVVLYAIGGGLTGAFVYSLIQMFMDLAAVLSWGLPACTKPQPTSLLPFYFTTV